MGRVAAIGERVAVQGFALGGAVVYPADDAAAVRDAWRQLPPDVAVVIVTRAAARALGDDARARRWPLVTEVPE
ncbi:MAG: hypothetical protein HY241_13090 [Actinobacteria bacterium]|nr:hypothetical protein [Actinomycetota bacterium]